MKNLSKEEYNKAKKVGLRKLIKANIKIYNLLCNSCRIKTVRVSQRKKVRINDYCDVCKVKAIELLEVFK